MIIGRKEEVKQLERAYQSGNSEFVAVYGRRRIGKTFLVRETFNTGFTFQYTGIHGVSNQAQIEEFYKSLVSYGLPETANKPTTWFDAFHLLEEVIVSSPHERKIVFIDELPWMDSANSNFVPAFEHFWNGWASARKDVLLIICGSATSWMLNKVIRNKHYGKLEVANLCLFNHVSNGSGNPFFRLLILATNWNGLSCFLLKMSQ